MKTPNTHFQFYELNTTFLKLPESMAFQEWKMAAGMQEKKDLPSQLESSDFCSQLWVSSQLTQVKIGTWHSKCWGKQSENLE